MGYYYEVNKMAAVKYGHETISFSIEELAKRYIRENTGLEVDVSKGEPVTATIDGEKVVFWYEEIPLEEDPLVVRPILGDDEQDSIICRNCGYVLGAVDDDTCAIGQNFCRHCGVKLLWPDYMLKENKEDIEYGMGD